MTIEERSPSGASKLELIGIGLCFLLSGFAALLYETVWLRQFSIHFGTSEQALAIVLGTYMGGLALGSLLASRYAALIRRPLLAYGIFELGIAVSALAVPWLLLGIRQIQIWFFANAEAPPEAGEFSQVFFALLGAAVATIVPTTLMGATLPMLAKHVVDDDEHLGRRVGGLYAINTLGAVAGTLMAAFVFLPAIGLWQTILVGAAGNLFVFLIVWVMAKRGNSGRFDLVTDSAPIVMDQTQSWILWVMLGSSAVSFVYEILFTRMIGHLLGGSVFAFASMLAAFLTGIAIGGAVASRLAQTQAKSAMGYFYAQCLTALLSLFSWHALQTLATTINQAASINQSQSIPRVFLAIAILIPPAISIGMTFPWAIRILARNETEAAPASAKVYAMSTIGGVLGAFVTGTYLLPWTSYSNVLLIALLGNLILAALVWVNTRSSLRPVSVAHFGAVAAALLALAVLFPKQPEALLRSGSFENFTRYGSLAYVKTGRSATVTMFNDAGQYTLSTNGLPEAGTTPEGQLKDATAAARWLGLLPAVLRPNAKSMCIVGFGSGVAPTHTPDSVRSIDVFELEEGVIEANRLVSSEREDDPFSDPRINVILNDGRSGLALTEKRYDLIVSQPSHPWTAGASHLYTKEFAESVKSHLNEDGLFLLWMDQQFVDTSVFKSLGKTLGNIFPHISLFKPNHSTLLFVGSLAEIVVPIENPKPNSASDRTLFRQMGLTIPGILYAMRALDDEGLRAASDDAPVTTDNNNLLALRRLRPQDYERINQELNALINQHDPLFRSPLLTTEVPGLDWVTIVVRRILLKRTESAKRLIEKLSDPCDGLLLRGLYASQLDESQTPVELFRECLQKNPDHAVARTALALAMIEGSGSQEDDQAASQANLDGSLEPSLLALVQSTEDFVKNDFSRMVELDPLLQKIPLTHPLHPQASLVRLHWRSRDPSSGSQLQRGRAMLQLIEEVAPFIDAKSILMYRLKGAAFANEAAITMSTAKQVADFARRQSDPMLNSVGGDNVGSDFEPMDVNELRLRLVNALTAIAAFENDPRVPPYRFYGVKYLVESQLAKLQ